MSSSAWVGAVRDGQKIGVYLHSDGRPEHVLPALREMIGRDGARAVADMILSADRGGWSSLNPHILNGSGRGIAVEGYGEKYDDAPYQIEPADLWAACGGFMEHCYVIDPEAGVIEWCKVAAGQPMDWDWQVASA